MEYISVELDRSNFELTQTLGSSTKTELWTLSNPSKSPNIFEPVWPEMCRTQTQNRKNQTSNPSGLSTKIKLQTHPNTSNWDRPKTKIYVWIATMSKRNIIATLDRQVKDKEYRIILIIKGCMMCVGIQPVWAPLSSSLLLLKGSLQKKCNIF